MKVNIWIIVAWLLLGASVVSQSNQAKGRDAQADHGKIVWQFDTKG